MSFQAGLKTIVVATDLKGRSDAALEYARKFASAYGSRIVLAHGLDPLEYAAVDEVPGQVLNGLPEEARTALDEMAAELVREGIPSHSEVRQGAVAQMLVDVARQYEAGLIVVGTRGSEGAGPVVVGAVAEQLVRLAPCPVLAVAADWNAGEFRPAPGGPVLLALELNEAAPAAVATASSLAKTFARTLLVLHARGAGDKPHGSSGAAALDSFRLDDFGIRLEDGIPVDCILEDGNPADAIAAAIEQHHPCVLVAGVKRASQTPGPHGTAFNLLARSRVPILCVPPELVSAQEEREVCTH